MSYFHWNADSRLKLEAWKEDVVSNGEIARRLGCHVSTIGRELERNGEPRSSWYDAKQAEKLSRIRRRDATRESHAKFLPGSWLASFAEDKLKTRWSPEQIAGRSKRVRKKSVFHERIYKTSHSKIGLECGMLKE